MCFCFVSIPSSILSLYVCSDQKRLEVTQGKETYTGDSWGKDSLVAAKAEKSSKMLAAKKELLWKLVVCFPKSPNITRQVLIGDQKTQQLTLV